MAAVQMELLMHAVAAALHARDCALMYSSCTSSTVMNAMHVCIDALYCVFSTCALRAALLAYTD